MADDKTQLDVYRIDRTTVLNEIQNNLSGDKYNILINISHDIDNKIDIVEENIHLFFNHVVNHIIQQQNKK